MEDTVDSVQNADLAGQEIAQYAIVSLIGAGGMGKVYRARDTRLRRDVAIKIVGAADRPRHVVQRGLIEARALSRLNHPHVAAIYDFLMHRGHECIVMEFVPGATLKQILAGGPLPVPEVLRLGRQLVDGLAAAHAANMIHRDIKPGNLKVTSSGELKILDFGSAKQLTGFVVSETDSETSSGEFIVGTVPYMSPEQLRGETIDERSDIFSVGAVLYEMASGRPAFPYQQLGKLLEAILFEEPPDLSDVNPFIPRALEHVVARAMEKDRLERYQTASELADDLESVASPARSHDEPSPKPGWWGVFAG
jgi:serine/threonine protein kinase